MDSPRSRKLGQEKPRVLKKPDSGVSQVWKLKTNANKEGGMTRGGVRE